MIALVSKYNHIYNKLLKLIITGEWKISAKIPSEKILKNHFNVSRLTIRKSKVFTMLSFTLNKSRSTNLN